jgi:hypothetical protein
VLFRAMADNLLFVSSKIRTKLEIARVARLAKLEAGRDPSAITMIVHAILDLKDKPLGKDRAIFSGSLEQIGDDVKGCTGVGAD